MRVILNVYDFSVVDGIIRCESKGVGRFAPGLDSLLNFVFTPVAHDQLLREFFSLLRGWNEVRPAKNDCINY